MSKLKTDEGGKGPYYDLALERNPHFQKGLPGRRFRAPNANADSSRFCGC